MFSAHAPRKMFYILFAVYFLLSRVFLSCSFAPSLLELQPKICSHNLFRPVCICLFVFLHRNLKQETDRNACQPCTHNHSCVRTHIRTRIHAHMYITGLIILAPGICVETISCFGLGRKGK